MKSFSEAYILKIKENNITDELGIIKIQYALAVLKSELIKTIFLICIFALIGQLKPFLVVMFLILPIRFSTGGIHLKTSISCFFLSLGYFLLTVCLMPMIHINTNMYYFIFALSLLIISICPLAPSEQRPIVSRKKYLQNKSFSIFYLFIFAIIVFGFITNKTIVAICIWALFVHAIELLFLKLHKKKEEL